MFEPQKTSEYQVQEGGRPAKQQTLAVLTVTQDPNTKAEIKKVKELILKLLETDQRCRNDDKWLTYRTFQQIAEEYNQKIYIPYELFQVLPAFETVKRLRAYIQNKDGLWPPTDPDVRDKRTRRAATFRSEMKS